jgi:hypothetical protein
MARWGHSDRDYLFWAHDFYAVRDNRCERMKKAIDEAAPETIRNGNLEEVASAQRRGRLEKLDRGTGSLGIPIKRAGNGVSPSPQPQRIGHCND